MRFFIPLIIVAVGFSSCGPLNSKYLYEHPEKDMSGYVSPVANVNVQKEKGQGQNTTFLGLNHLENQSSYNFGKVLFAQAGFYFGRGFMQGEGGLGYHEVFAKGHLMFTPSMGYGYGQADYRGMVQWSSERGPLNVGGFQTFYRTRLTQTSYNQNKIYLQANLTWFPGTGNNSFTFGAKLNYLHYNYYKFRVQNYSTLDFNGNNNPPPINDPGFGVSGITTEDISQLHKDAFVLNPYITFTHNVGSMAWFFQALLNTPLNKADIQNKDHLINGPRVPLLSVGMMFRLDNRKTKQQY